jgi:hypothetical protein
MIFLVTSCTQGQLIEGDASVAETNGPALVSEAVLDLEDTVTERLDDVKNTSQLRSFTLMPHVAPCTQLYRKRMGSPGSGIVAWQRHSTHTSDVDFTPRYSLPRKYSSPQNVGCRCLECR